MEFITQNLEMIILSILVILLIFIGLFIMILRRLLKIKRNYTQMMKGTNISNLEEVIIQIQQDLKQLQTIQMQHSQTIRDLQSEAKKMKSNIGFLRYNAFGQQGSDLSFSMAIIDQYLNGVILTGLHSREETYIYAKPLEQGNSKYALSPEEKEVINLAVKKQ